LRAERGVWGGYDVDRPSVSATYLGWLAIATIAVRPDDESLDSTDMYVEPGTELNECVLDRIDRRIAKAGRCRPSPSRSRSSSAFNPSEICCAAKPDSLQQHAHSAGGNIVLGAT
jgi:hypothetical protein